MTVRYHQPTVEQTRRRVQLVATLRQNAAVRGRVPVCVHVCFVFVKSKRDHETLVLRGTN
jgi:hypothetical protein